MQTAKKDAHVKEPADQRSEYLRIRKKIWIVPVSGAVLALVFFLVYTLVIVTVRGQKQYTEDSTFELSFAYNENTQEAYDYYNAYTWQGLLFTHPDIADVIEEELPEGMTMEEAKEATKADLISDIRFLTVTVTTDDPEKTAGLSKAIQDALVSFGDSAKEFDKIEFLSATEPALVVVSDRSRNAALLGLALGIVFSVFALWLHEVLDDAVYTPEDVRRRYGLSVLSVTEKDGARPIPAFLKEEGKEDLDALTKQYGTVLLKAEKKETEEKAAAALGRKELVPAGDAALSGKPVLLVLTYGEARGTMTEHVLSRLREQGAVVCGAVLFAADGKFLSQYYRIKRDDA